MHRHFLIGLLLASCSSSEAQEELVSATSSSAQYSFEWLDVPAPPVFPRGNIRMVERGNPREAEWITKIGVSEGHFDLGEFKALLQTLENMRKPGKSLLYVMQRQCARVTRRKPFTDTRQIWVSYLRMYGDGPPAKGWIECTGTDPKTNRRTPAGCTGDWDSVAPQWVAFRDQAVKIYWSGEVEEVIEGRPIQWGGDMDYWRGVQRKFCPLPTDLTTRNTYWGRPSENDGVCLPIDPAKIWASKRQTKAIMRARAKRRHLIPQLLGVEDSLIHSQNRKGVGK